MKFNVLILLNLLLFTDCFPQSLKLVDGINKVIFFPEVLASGRFQYRYYEGWVKPSSARLISSIIEDIDLYGHQYAENAMISWIDDNIDSLVFREVSEIYKGLSFKSEISEYVKSYQLSKESDETVKDFRAFVADDGVSRRIVALDRGLYTEYDVIKNTIMFENRFGENFSILLPKREISSTFQEFETLLVPVEGRKVWVGNYDENLLVIKTSYKKGYGNYFFDFTNGIPVLKGYLSKGGNFGKKFKKIFRSYFSPLGCEYPVVPKVSLKLQDIESDESIRIELVIVDYWKCGGVNDTDLDVSINDSTTIIGAD